MAAAAVVARRATERTFNIILPVAERWRRGENADRVTAVSVKRAIQPWRVSFHRVHAFSRKVSGARTKGGAV